MGKSREFVGKKSENTLTDETPDWLSIVKARSFEGVEAERSRKHSREKIVKITAEDVIKHVPAIYTGPMPEWVKFCRLEPRAHQIIGVERLIRQPYFALFDEMGAGKTAQVINAAQVLWSRDLIEQVIVVCPAAIRSVWYDPEFGELRKHLWKEGSAIIEEYHVNTRKWSWSKIPEALRWVITNYDYIRNPDNAEWLFKLIQRHPKTLLVLDESSAVKSSKSIQSRMAYKLRKKCRGVILLNGTPIANTPLDLFMQCQIMHPSILECKTEVYFKSRYAILGGFKMKVCVEWRDIDNLQQRIAPHVLRRLKSDCLDLPNKLDPITLVVPLTENSWRIYKELRDEMITQIDSGRVATASEAGVRAMRLSQITSGFLGGVETIRPCEACQGEDDECNTCGGTGGLRTTMPPQIIGVEKIDTLVCWLKGQLDNDPKFKVLIWCRFRPELFRLVDTLRGFVPNVGAIVGGQDRRERDQAVQLLDPRSAPDGPVVVVGTRQSGGMGLTMTASHNVLSMSSDYSLKNKLQADDRVHRMGQLHPVSYYDIVATGPSGQKTIDSIVLQALRHKEDVANWTMSAWRQAVAEQ